MNAKHTERYWRSRITHRSESANYQIRFQFGGKQIWFNLHSGDKDVAATKARDIWLSLHTVGLEKTLAIYKPESQVPVSVPTTVGEWIVAVRPILLGGRISVASFNMYVKSLRRIVSCLAGLDKDLTKYSKLRKDEWREKCDAFKLSELTNDRVKAWARGRIDSVTDSPKQLASTKRTLNAQLIGCAALFREEIRRELPNVSLPSPPPFSEIPRYDKGKTKYVSTINAKTILIASIALRDTGPEQYKIILLALCAGLRRKEIDLLEWSALDFVNSKIMLRETQYLSLKTEESADEIEVDSQIMEELRAFKQKATGPFVVEAPGRSPTPPEGHDYQYYRCYYVFDDVMKWLRDHGVTAQKPLHELRKEVGSILATEHGIFAASRFLRHANIQTTAAHYADQKKRISAGLGAVLRPDVGEKRVVNE